jgi:hypothetical protein
VFYLNVTYVCNGFLKCFFYVFASVSYVYFQLCRFFYVVAVVFECFKSRSCVAHEMHVESGWRLAWRSGRRGPTVGAFAREPNTLDAHSLPIRTASGHWPIHCMKPHTCAINDRWSHDINTASCLHIFIGSPPLTHTCPLFKQTLLKLLKSWLSIVLKYLAFGLET